MDLKWRIGFAFTAFASFFLFVIEADQQPHQLQ